MTNELEKSVADILDEAVLLANKDKRITNLLKKIEYSRSDLETHFSNKERPLLQSFIGLHKFSLTWIVKQLFKQNDGRPLELLPFQSCLLDMLWSYKYPMVLATRGAGKTFMYALYAILRAVLIPGQQVVIVGAGFRQAKLVFNYISKLYQASPLLQEALQPYGGPKYAVDQCWLSCGSSNIYAIPLGDGERIRGLRATCILCDEFASIPEDIYEIVVQPFAAVHADPARRARMIALKERLLKLNAPEQMTSTIEKALGFGNQICISGTASYEFNHFYRKWLMYNKIISSNGDDKLIRQAFMEGNTYLTEDSFDNELMKAFKHTDYAIFQLPYTGVPKGFLDDVVIANAKLTLDPARFGMEYLTRFAKDSDGVFKRSLLEEATPIKSRDGFEVQIELFGENGAEYVLGIDPARHSDNLALVVLKLTQRGYEVVYCWAMNNKDWPTAAAKIREILNRFNIVRIEMDQGGGGAAIMDLLQNRKFLEPGEEPIWQIDNDDTKNQVGRHILDMFQWSNQWISEAVYAMHAEFRHRRLLLPHRVDEENILNQYAIYHNKKLNSISKSEKEWIFSELYGEINDDGDKKSLGVWDNIQEMVTETCSIVKKVTDNGTETFILPPLSAQEKQGKLTDKRRRDRYSALLLAAYGARVLRGHGFDRRLLPGGTDSQFRRQNRNVMSIRRGPNGIVFPGN